MNEFLIYRSSMIFQLAFLLLFLPLTKQKWKVIMGTATAFILTSIVDYMNFDPTVHMNRLLNVLLWVVAGSGSVPLQIFRLAGSFHSTLFIKLCDDWKCSCRSGSCFLWGHGTGIDKSDIDSCNVALSACTYR